VAQETQVKLYSVPHSPYAARIRLALRFKGLAWEDLGLPAEGLKSPGFLAINPIGKIPVLLTDDVGPIIESETILQYLEERWPEPSLTPDDARGRTRMRTVIRVCENYVSNAAIDLFPLLAPDGRNAAVLQAALDKWRRGLGLLASVICTEGQAAGPQPSLADCMVFPVLHLCTIIGPRLTVDEPLAPFPQLADYYARGLEDPWLKACHDEIVAGLKALYASRT